MSVTDEHVNYERLEEEEEEGGGSAGEGKCYQEKIIYTQQPHSSANDMLALYTCTQSHLQCVCSKQYTLLAAIHAHNRLVKTAFRFHIISLLLLNFHFIHYSHSFMTGFYVVVRLCVAVYV